MQRVGILHPGKMGITIAASARNSGNEVYWVSEGRSRQTLERAAGAGLIDAGSLPRLCEICSVIVSVCPPEFAEETADQVAQCAFRGVFVDANAISPQRTRRIDRRMHSAGIDFVDGGIIGPPAVKRGTTWLYLSGRRAAGVAPCFSEGPVETEVLAGEPGRASALKMCFASYTKGSAALLCAVLAAAEQLGVLEDLKRQWTRNGPSFPEVAASIRQASPKAWRFVAEMHEIAATFQAAGLPPEFHRACAEIYARLEGFKDTTDPGLDDVLAALIQHHLVGSGSRLGTRRSNRRATGVFEDFERADFPISADFAAFPNRDDRSFIYIIFWVNEGQEVPFYVGRTGRLSERMEDYWTRQFAAPTDFRVGEAICYLRDVKGFRVVVRYRSSSDSQAEEHATIRDLQTSGVRLLNDLVGYQWKHAKEEEERNAVRNFCDIIIRSVSSARPHHQTAGKS